MANYKTVNRLKKNCYSVFVILVLTCLSAVLGYSTTTTHIQLPTGKSITTSTVATSPLAQETTIGVNSTYSGLLFNAYVDMRWLRYIFSRLVAINWFYEKVELYE